MALLNQLETRYGSAFRQATTPLTHIWRPLRKVAAVSLHSSMIFLMKTET